MKPGTRHFIGPLTPAQQRRRERSRSQFKLACTIADARNCTMADAFKIAWDHQINGWKSLRMSLDYYA